MAKGAAFSICLSPKLLTSPQGVVVHRKCRDVLCLLLFIIFWIGEPGNFRTPCRGGVRPNGPSGRAAALPHM